ncbi:Uncharacterised protein [Serratia quinivorans]|uniref:hypothetical protein n=1 Tax=Serratia quinivorans TaxID=137545 RepID=UPI0021779214|nr:hypothetical protein [Serratia quinivorans]CAI1529747.1 Uncharacterised protein [Serratia quinivorans]
MAKHSDEIIRSLPLSHMIYRDSEIDKEKAEKLIVYHYPLSKSYRWSQWKNHLDGELGNRYYPYLMRVYKEQFGLFVAVDSEQDTPPIIKNSDGIIIPPERVKYDATLNPVWIRLIMRKVSAFGSHCKGSHSLGRPLLKTDVWRSKSSSGINTISLDCRTQQREDKDTTEVVLFYENVPLRPVDMKNESLSSSQALWIYDKNNVLVRWKPEQLTKEKYQAYQEIPKNKNKRKLRPFIDLSSPDALKNSWPWILQPVQKEFIEQAIAFGFTLTPVVLQLRPLPLKTKFKTTDRAKFPGVQLGTDIKVLDLRFSRNVPTQYIVTQIQNLLNRKYPDVLLTLLPDIEPSQIGEIETDNALCILVLLDQTPGIIDDRYPLTQTLKTKVACQHINVNPFDLIGDPITDNLLIEQLTSDGNIRLIPATDSCYYDYTIRDFEKKGCQDALARNAEVVYKELALKHLLLCNDTKISTSLTEQKDLLNDDLLVITEGYLFTVEQDRPVFLPFNPSEPDLVTSCDKKLESFNISVAALLELLKKKWPCSYRPEAVMQGFGSDAEKLTKFSRKLTIIIHRMEGISILLQDPQYETPHMLPENLNELMSILDSQCQQLSLHQWLLPEIEELIFYIEQLNEEGELSDTNKNTLLRELELLCELWRSALKESYRNSELNVTYDVLKSYTFSQWPERKNALITDNVQKSVKRASTSLIASWNKLLSRVFDLPLGDPRNWLKNVPGITRLWHDPEQNYVIVGSLASPQPLIQRQPSIRQWHALQGKLSPELLAGLVDVDWVRMNQLAGNPCVATLIRRWKECQIQPDKIRTASLTE